MEHIYLPVIGILFAAVSWAAIPLSRFIKKIDEGDRCPNCQRHDDCFAMKELFSGRSNCVSEWMLVSFLKIRKSCPCIEITPFKYKVLCFILSMLLFIVSLWSKGMNLAGCIFGVAAIMLLFLSIVDWNTQYIPAECSIIIFICGLIHLFADFSNWVDYLIGLFAVSGFLLFVDKISTPILRERYQGETEIEHVIGDGDIKLMAATGLLLGWQFNFLALGIGCVAGSVIHLILMKIREADRQFAFGPYLSLGVFITMICGEQLVSWYLGLMG